MNTVAKGNVFEDKAFDIIIAALNEGKLGFIPGKCRTFRKPRYYGRDREAYVNFDLSLEVWPDDDAERYTHLCLIECKDYGHSVNVKEIIKFVGDISSVAGKNVKGIFITTNKLQKAAKSYANSHGLMVMHVSKDGKATIILHNNQRNKSNGQVDAPVREFSGKLDQLAEINDYYELNSFATSSTQDWCNALYDFLYKVLNDQRRWRQPDNQIEGAQRRSAKLIEQIALDIINEFDPSILPKYQALPMLRFVKYFSQKFDVKVITDNLIPKINGKKINGFIDMGKKEIHIDRDIVGTQQFNFVLAHEMGHYFLHSTYDADQLSFDNLKDSEYSILLGKHALINAKHWIEWQANQFAACFLMPHNTLLAQTLIFQIRNGINGHRGSIYVDHQMCNQQAFDMIKDQFTNYFQVSNAALEYRLSDLNILKFGPGGNYRRTDPTFERNSRSIGEIIKKVINVNE